MGRGVMTYGEHIVYFDATGCEDNNDWSDMEINIRDGLMKGYPSLIDIQDWKHRKIVVFLENDHIRIGIAEYCGCGAISVFINDHSERPELAEHWLEQCWPGLQKIIKENVWGSTLIRLGTMSNGISVYREEK